MWPVPVTISWLCCLHFYHLETSVGVCGYCTWQYQIPVDSRSSLLQHSRLHGLLFGSAPFPMGVCECVGEKCKWQFLANVFLWQLSSTGIIWGICVYCVAFWRIRQWLCWVLLGWSSSMYCEGFTKHCQWDPIGFRVTASAVYQQVSLTVLLCGLSSWDQCKGTECVAFHR